MRRSDLKTMTLAQLVERFVEIALAQDKALLHDEIRKFNRLFDEMEAVETELKNRDGDQRRALIALYSHPNMQVRVKAAKATLAIAPHAARELLKAIKDSQWHPQALEAGMSLWNLDQGIFKPT